MERRRRLQLVNKEDNEEEVDRRYSPRKRKMVIYDSEEEIDVDTDSDIEEVDDQSDDEQPAVSTSNTSSVKNSLRVSCGNKKGVLDKEKLARGKDCIEHNGRWFSPSAFEQFGGRGSSKKWRTSIFYNNKPLQFWLDQGALTNPPFKGRLSQASVSSDRKESHPKGTVIQSAAEHEHTNELGHNEEPAETEKRVAVEKEGTSEINTCFEYSVLQKNAKVVIKRLPGHIQDRLHLQSNEVVRQENGCCLKPKDEENKKEKKHTTNVSSATEIYNKETSERIKKENTEIKISTEEDSESDHCEIKVLTVHSPPHLLSSPADISPDVSGLDAAQQQQIEKLPQTDSPCPIMAGPAPMLLTSTKLETMEIEQLKREKN